jgi:hypothetical protein
MGNTFKDQLQIEIEFLSKDQASLDQLLLSLTNIDKLLKAVEADAAGAGAINKVFNKEGLANFERTLQQTQKSIEAISKKGVDFSLFSGGDEKSGARLLNILEQVGKTVAAINGKPFKLDLSSVDKARGSFTQLQSLLGSLKDTPGFKALPSSIQDTLDRVATSAGAQVKKIAKLPDDILRDIGGASFKKKIADQQVALLKELFATFTKNAQAELATIQAAYEATKKQLAQSTADATKLEQKVKTLQEKVDAAKAKAKTKGKDSESVPSPKVTPERQKVVVDVELGKIKQPEPPPVIVVDAKIGKVIQPEPPPVIKVTGEVEKITVPKAQKIKLEAEIVTKGQGGDPIADIIKGFKKNEKIDEQAANALSKYVNDLRAAKIEVEKYRKALEDARAAGDKPGALQAGKNLQAAAAQYATLRSEYSALATTIKKISEHADSAKFGEEKVRRLGEQAKSAFEALDSADKKIREFGKLRSTAQENAFLQQEKKLLADITAQITELGNEARIAGVKFKEKGPLDDLARELQLLRDITAELRNLAAAAERAAASMGKTSGFGKFGGATGESLDSFRKSAQLINEELRKTEIAAGEVQKRLAAGDSHGAQSFFKQFKEGNDAAEKGIAELQKRLVQLQTTLASRANAPEEVKKALAGLITEFENGIKQLQSRASQLGNPVKQAIETAQTEAAKKLSDIISGLNANQGQGFNATAIKRQVAVIQQELTSVLSASIGRQAGPSIAED